MTSRHTLSPYHLTLSGSSPQDETTAVPALVSSAHGTVIEIGPGSGSHLPHFTALVASGTITKIYGVEPTLALHPALRQAVKKAKLDDVYEIVPCGTEEGETLSRYGLTEGTVDCVISIQVLCSVPRPREVVKELYGLLKPGGEMVIWEHVASTDVISRLVQRVYLSYCCLSWAVQWLTAVGIYNPVWSFAVANCQLNRETERYLLEAGNWERVSLEGDKDAGWSVFPRAWGRLVKAREVDEAVKREEEW